MFPTQQSDISKPKPQVTSDDFGPTREKQEFVAEAVKEHRQRRGRTPLPRVDMEDWTDYTTYASGLDTYVPSDQDRLMDKDMRFQALLERKRSLGIDFGPSFTGLALSAGGVNTIPMGTVKTGTDWKATAVKIAQIASTRKVRDIVIGLPLEFDGSDGEVAVLVRHFAQLLADASLLLLGTDAAVYLWDERYSTQYAAMRLVTRPKFDGHVFKTWIDGQRGLDFSAKALLDSEAARAILEHWLDKDPRSDRMNKEFAERIAPSRAACREYLRWKKRPVLKLKRPEEPAGPGIDAWVWDDMHQAEIEQTEDDMAREQRNIENFYRGSDHWGDGNYHRPRNRQKHKEVTKLRRERWQKKQKMAEQGGSREQELFKSLGAEQTKNIKYEGPMVAGEDSFKKYNIERAQVQKQRSVEQQERNGGEEGSTQRETDEEQST